MIERIKAWNQWRKRRKDLCPLCKFLILIGVKHDKTFEITMAIRRIGRIARSLADGLNATTTLVDETPPKEEPKDD